MKHELQSWDKAMAQLNSEHQSEYPLHHPIRVYVAKLMYELNEATDYIEHNF